jgi:ribonuclease PH
MRVTMNKPDPRGGLDPRTIRPVEVVCGFHTMSEGSVLYRSGRTLVLCTASIEDGVPRWLEGEGKGWLTAEYQMHPRSNPKRRERRDGRDRPVSGRTREIERLVGRSLRAALDLKALGERTVHVDCDVLEADGGTRTASISGGFIALCLALAELRRRGALKGPVLADQVAAVSAGHVDGALCLDLCYEEDSAARVDLNLVSTSQGAIVEVQGTAEGRAIPRDDLDQLIDLALSGIHQISVKQREALSAHGVDLDALLVH